jgi:hypothetical protein
MVTDCDVVYVPPAKLNDGVAAAGSVAEYDPYVQRSIKSPPFPVASTPLPPKSQRLPLPSIQVPGEIRPPGVFVEAGVSNVP